jgi:hypothetical protein
VEVLTPGTTEKRYLAGALDLSTGTITPCVWYRKQTGLFLDLLDTLDRARRNSARMRTCSSRGSSIIIGLGTATPC